MRDFRDAKAMAHGLRHALQSRAVETTHSESLELIAKAFGYDNWNILSAKIEAAVCGCRCPKLRLLWNYVCGAFIFQGVRRIQRRIIICVFICISCLFDCCIAHICCCMAASCDSRILLLSSRHWT